MNSRAQRWTEDESGQVIVLVAVLMVALVAVVGLVTDGGMVFTQRRDLQNVADAAALAGAMQIDQNAYRSSGGTTVILDEQAARAAAAEYLQAEGGLAYQVSVTVARVDVSVSRQAGTGFLRVLGISGFQISAAATAEPRHGIAAAAQ